MRLLVCGGRDFENKLGLYAALDAVHRKKPITVLVHGGATGADRLAGLWASENKVRVEVYAADWDGQGKAAGPIRNQRMIDHGKPDAAVAFAGGSGTADMVRRLESAGIKVWQPNVPPEPWYRSVKAGDWLKAPEHWNSTMAKGSQLPDPCQVLGVRHVRGSHAGTLFLVRMNDGQEIELDTGWFDPPQA